MKFFDAQKYATVSLSLFLVTFFAGCNWFKSTSKSSSLDSSDTLLTIKGKPVLSVQEYESKVEAAKQANPQIAQLLAMMPNAEKDLLFRGMVLEAVLKEWAEREKLEKDPEFQAMRDQVHKSVDAQLYYQAFDKANPVSVSDDEVKKFYQERKNTIPGLIVTPAVEGKSEAVYRDFNDPEIKEGLRRMLIEERKQKQLETLFEDLKSEFNVLENTKYFENKFGKSAQVDDQNDMTGTLERV